MYVFLNIGMVLVSFMYVFLNSELIYVRISEYGIYVGISEYGHGFGCLALFLATLED